MTNHDRAHVAFLSFLFFDVWTGDHVWTRSWRLKPYLIPRIPLSEHKVIKILLRNSGPWTAWPAHAKYRMGSHFIDAVLSKPRVSSNFGLRHLFDISYSWNGCWKGLRLDRHPVHAAEVRENIILCRCRISSRVMLSYRYSVLQSAYGHGRRTCSCCPCASRRRPGQNACVRASRSSTAETRSIWRKGRPWPISVF